MTSFWGYVTEGVLLLILSMWWMINTFVDVIKCKHKGQTYSPRLAYPWPGTGFPVETVYKLALATIGILGQLAYAGSSFHDEAGNFKSMPELMYMTIYGLFVLHSIFEFLQRCGVPVIKGINYAALAIAFGWYALALSDSAGDAMATDDKMKGHGHSAEDMSKPAPSAGGMEEDHGGMPQTSVAYLVRSLPVYLLSSISLMLILESTWSMGAWTALVRTFCLQSYATWCCHSAHILHSPTPFPGSGPNPDWDMTDHRNIAFTVSFFGIHLCLNLVALATAYTVTAYVLRMRCGFKVDNVWGATSGGYDYRRVATDEDATENDKEVTAKLLASGSRSCC